MLRLVLLGPPGAGKGTQAKRLAADFGLVALSSGDILRGEIKAGTAVGKKAEGYVKSGTLVPDAVITEVMLAGIDRVDPGAGFILDGFPRTVPQAEALEGGLAARRRPLDAVIDFDMNDGEIVRRIVSRRSCGNCGAVYNLEFLPPRVPDVCDACGSALVQRVDDTETTVVTRLATYRRQTAPLVAHYEACGLLRRVDGAAPADRVQLAIRRIVESLGKRG